MTKPRTIGPYRLTAIRATSAAGQEYAALDTDLGAKVLLTILEPFKGADWIDEAGREAFQRDYQQLMTRLVGLDHPLLGMPRRVSAPSAPEFWYTSSPSEGTPLRRHLEHRGIFEWRTVALILLELCTPLGIAHQRAIAHGNISVDSVLMEPNGAARLVRPSVVGRMLVSDPAYATLSLASLWDEPVTLSPEVLNRRALTPTDDVYALGVLAFQLLTGQLPYASTSEPLGRFQSRRSAPDPTIHSPAIPEPVSRLVRTMLAPRSAIRIPDAAALRAELLQQLLPELGPDGGRSALVGALRARVSTQPVAPLASQLPPVDRADAERAVEQALLAAGMTSTRAESASSAPRRGLWFALGVTLIAVAAVALSTPRSPVVPSSSEVSPRAGTSPPESLQEAEPQVSPVEATTARAAAPPKSPVVDPREVARLKAEALIGSKEHDLAIRVLQRALQSAGDPEGSLGMLLGSALEQEGRLAEAVKAYVASDGADASRSAGHLKAGVLVATDGRCPEAIPLFLEVEARRGPSAETLKHVGNCQLIVGDLPSALVSLKRAYELNTDDLDIVVPLGQALEKRREFLAARDMYRHALNLDPNDRRARQGMTRLRESPGTPGRPLVEPGVPLLGATEVVDLEALEMSAHEAFRAGQFAVASKRYGDAVAAAGDAASASLLRNYAIALHKAGQGRPAVRAYERASEAAPEDAELHYLKGVLLSSEGRDRQAAAALQDALALEPSRLKARFELGLVSMRRGRHGEAVQAFQGVLQQDPGHRAALQNLIKARLDGGDQAGALEALGKMHARHPREPQTLLNMAALLERMDRDDEARALLSDACAKGLKEACK